MSNVLKKSLQTTIFTTVLGTAAIAQAPAATIHTDLISLNPVTPWSVSRAGAGDQAYCTLSKTFKDNIILTLAENAGQSLTFALDFQKDRFLKQSSYNVILATDNGDSRSYEINPATEKAFILRVKNDPEFYENLWKSNSLIVSVNTENYRFNTADFVEGKQNIATCVNSLESIKPKEAPKQQISGLKPEINNVPVSTTSTVKADNAALHIAAASPGEALNRAPKLQTAGFTTERMDKLSNVAQEVEKLKAENSSLKKALFDERKAFKDKITTAQNGNKQEAQELLQKVSLLSSENEKLKAEIRQNAKNKTLQASTMAQKLSTEIDRLKSENNMLKASLSAAKISNEKQELETVSLSDYEALQDKNSVLSEQIRTLTTENYKLQNMLQEASLSGNSDEAYVQELSSANQKLKQQAVMKDNRIAALQKALANSQSKVQGYDQMQQQMAQLQAQNQNLTQSYAALEAAAGEVTPSNADAELQALQLRYAEQQREIQRMTDMLEQQRQEFELEQRRLETMLFDPAVTEQKQLAHLAKLEKELQLANQALAEQRAMYEGGAPMSDESRKMLKPAAQMSNSERITMMEMSKEIQRLRDEIDRLRRAPQQPVVQKATLTEKKVIVGPGQTLDTAMSVEKVEEQIMAKKAALQQQNIAAEEPLLPPAERIMSETTQEPVIDIDDKPVKMAAVQPSAAIAAEEGKAVLNAVKSTPAAGGTAARGPIVLALPDPEMEKMLKKQDTGIEIKGRQNGMVYWASDNVEGTVIRKHMQGQEFEASVEQMITNLKNKCPAVLEIEPVVLRKGKEGNLYAYDADCGNSAIGLIFFSKDGQTVSTVSYGAHESNKSSLEAKREKLIEALMGSMQS